MHIQYFSFYHRRIRHYHHQICLFYSFEESTDCCRYLCSDHTSSCLWDSLHVLVYELDYFEHGIYNKEHCLMFVLMSLICFLLNERLALDNDKLHVTTAGLSGSPLLYPIIEEFLKRSNYTHLAKHLDRFSLGIISFSTSGWGLSSKSTRINVSRRHEKLNNGKIWHDIILRNNK